MLTIELELLGGRYVATEHSDRWRAEWPPHPARFFSALVAALHDRDPVDEDEREALLWLEQQGPPVLDVDLSVDETVGRREVLTAYVPVNDVTLIGDPERRLREIRQRLSELEKSSESEATVAEIKKLRAAAASEQKKVERCVAAQRSSPKRATKKDLELAILLLPERRKRQERTFPVIVPERTSFAFQWPDADPREHRAALQRLCERVTRLGHSSSLVRCTIIDKAIKPSLVPRVDGEHVLRVVGRGQLARLESAYARHQSVEARVLPARPQRYGGPVKEDLKALHSAFSDEWIVFERIDGHRPLASRGSDLAVALRRVLIEIHGKPDLPPALSGHDMNGRRADQPHVAFVALPWVGHAFADGSVQGIALVPPRSMAPADRELLLRLIAKWEAERGDAREDYAVELGTAEGLGSPIKLKLKRVERISSKWTLNPWGWCRPSRCFVTATPIALDRHPGNLRSNTERTAHKAAAEAVRAIADGCERIGLPRPTRVLISLAPLLPGGQHVRQYSPWPLQQGRTRRARVHAEIVFEREVCGPVLIGAGRYFGLGLCLPMVHSEAMESGKTS